MPKTTSQKLPFSHDDRKTYREKENKIMVAVMCKRIFPSGPWKQSQCSQNFAVMLTIAVCAVLLIKLSTP